MITLATFLNCDIYVYDYDGSFRNVHYALFPDDVAAFKAKHMTAAENGLSK